MTGDWTSERVLALAPDASSAKSGRDLASARRWQNLGHCDAAIWGECQGSGSKPYQTQIDLSEPAFKCSCPSRKFPCKHGLGLFLLFAQQDAAIVRGDPPGWVREWLSSRSERAQKKQEKIAQPEKAPDPEAQARRVAEREKKVAAGVDQLRSFLQDVICRGLVAVQADGAGPWEQMGARMVDAQASGLARLLRDVGGALHSGDGWQQRVLHRLARLQLVVEAHGRLGALPAPLAADVQSLIGWTQSTDDLLKSEGVSDTWLAVGQRTSEEDRLRIQRTWLLGEQSRQAALLLQFAFAQQPFAATIMPGTAVAAELVFYPSAWPLRAQIKQRTGDVRPVTQFPGQALIVDALMAQAAALSRNPLLELYPMALEGVLIQRRGEGWALADRDGDCLPMAPRFAKGWEMLCQSGGRPAEVFGEWDGEFLHPLAMATGGEYTLLSGGELA